MKRLSWESFTTDTVARYKVNLYHCAEIPSGTIINGKKMMTWLIKKERIGVMRKRIIANYLEVTYGLLNIQPIYHRYNQKKAERFKIIIEIVDANCDFFTVKDDKIYTIYKSKFYTPDSQTYLHGIAFELPYNGSPIKKEYIIYTVKQFVFS